MLRISVSNRIKAALLLLVLLSLCIYSYLEYEHHIPYPNGVDVVSGRKGQATVVFIFGTVTDTMGKTSVVSAGGYNFTVTPITAKVGDKVEVLGRLEENCRITAEKTVVYDSTNYYLLFVRSLAGAGLLVFVFFKSWKFEWRKFKFVEG